VGGHTGARCDLYYSRELEPGACAISAGLSSFSIPNMHFPRDLRVPTPPCNAVRPGAAFMDSRLPDRSLDEVEGSGKSAEGSGHPLTIAHQKTVSRPRVRYIFSTRATGGRRNWADTGLCGSARSTHRRSFNNRAMPLRGWMGVPPRARSEKGLAQMFKGAPPRYWGCCSI